MERRSLPAAPTPLPLAGKGSGVGVSRADLACGYPPPQPSPARGEGERASLRKPIRPAFLDAALERGPGVHPRQPGAEVRIGSELVECFRHVADKAHLDIGAGQRVADKKFATAERAVDIAEELCRRH